MLQAVAYVLEPEAGIRRLRVPSAGTRHSPISAYLIGTLGLKWSEDRVPPPSRSEKVAVFMLARECNKWPLYRTR